MTRLLTATAIAALFATPVFAGNVAKCEIAIMQTVMDESGGIVSFGSYRPASNFLKSVYDEDTPISLTEDDHPIQGIICARANLMPDEDDYAILATGLPMVLSHDFDSPDSDTLTLFFADNRFQHKHVSEAEIDTSFEATLSERLADFSSRDHGLAVIEAPETVVDPESVLEDPDIGPAVETVAPVIDDEMETLPDDMTDDFVAIEDDAARADPVLTLATDTPDTTTMGPDSEVPDLSLTEEQTVTETLAAEDTAPATEESESVSSTADLVFDPETGTLVAADGSTIDLGVAEPAETP